ncbi:MAG: HNH endonuclease signature motif containing protein [Boseongicola sp.]|nr:HNH endonuclease signature motif containing protein [Boseongicola sp.]
MNRFLFKVNGEEHCPKDIARPKNAGDWEGGTVLIPDDGPSRIGSRGAAPSVAIGDEVWIWTHEDEQYGRGLGLTAQATAAGMSASDEFIEVVLRNVQLLDRPFGFRSFACDSTGSRILDQVDRNRAHNAYLIEDEDYPEFIAVVKERNAPLPNDVQDEHVQGWDRELAKYKDTLLKNLEIRRMATLKARSLQGSFRDALIRAYSGRCVVSGCKVPEALEAAHIMPHNGDPIWDQVENGLLLRRDLHALFDAFLWSVNPKSGSLHISARLNSTGYAKLAGRKVRHKAATELLKCHFPQFRRHADGHQGAVSSA